MNLPYIYLWVEKGIVLAMAGVFNHISQTKQMHIQGDIGNILNMLGSKSKQNAQIWFYPDFSLLIDSQKVAAPIITNF